MPAPAPLQCSVPDCDWETPAGTPTWEMCFNLLTLHTNAVHPEARPQPAAAAPARVLAKLPRPVFTLEMTEDAWNFTEIEWESYIQQTASTENQKLLQLRAACDDNLRKRVYDSGGYAQLDTTELLLARIKELAVAKVHRSVHLMNLYKMTQQSDEGIRAFNARLTGTADMCSMNVKCLTCQVDVSYRDETVKELIIHGMFNQDIRQRVLSRTSNNELTTLKDLVSYISAEEASVHENNDLHSPSSSLNAVKSSSYKSNKKSCNFCGGPRHTASNSLEDRKKMCRAFGKTCNNCGKTNHLSNVCNSSRPAGKQSVSGVEELSGGIHSITVDNLYSAGTSYPPESYYPSSAAHLANTIAVMRSEGPVTHVPLPHHVHDKIQGWMETRPKENPTLSVTFSVDKAAYSNLRLNFPRFRHNHNSGRSVTKMSTADTGAQLTVVPATLLDEMHIRSDSIFPVQSRLNAASNTPILVSGGILLEISARNDQTGVVKTTHQLCYVSSHVTGIFLSLSACVDLGVVPQNFPEVGSCDLASPAVKVQSVTSADSSKCSNSGVPTEDSQPCSCPRRELPPETPASLPCAPTPENVPRLREYILERYKSSAFNCCSHQPLRLMDGSPPLRIFVDESANLLQSTHRVRFPFTGNSLSRTALIGMSGSASLRKFQSTIPSPGAVAW